MSTHWAGFAGILLVLVAFLPQIFHLVKETCAAGISLWAFAIWWIASLLLLTYAVSINDPVFIALQGYQLAANTLIVLYTKKYENHPCRQCIDKYERYLSTIKRS